MAKPRKVGWQFAKQARPLGGFERVEGQGSRGMIVSPIMKPRQSVKFEELTADQLITEKLRYLKERRKIKRIPFLAWRRAALLRKLLNKETHEVIVLPGMKLTPQQLEHMNELQRFERDLYEKRGYTTRSRPEHDIEIEREEAPTVAQKRLRGMDELIREGELQQRNREVRDEFARLEKEVRELELREAQEAETKRLHEGARAGRALMEALKKTEFERITKEEGRKAALRKTDLVNRVLDAYEGAGVALDNRALSGLFEKSEGELFAEMKTARNKLVERKNDLDLLRSIYKVRKLPFDAGKYKRVPLADIKAEIAEIERDSAEKERGSGPGFIAKEERETREGGNVSKVVIQNSYIGRLRLRSKIPGAGQRAEEPPRKEAMADEAIARMKEEAARKEAEELGRFNVLAAENKIRVTEEIIGDALDEIRSGKSAEETLEVIKSERDFERAIEERVQEGLKAGAKKAGGKPLVISNSNVVIRGGAVGPATAGDMRKAAEGLRRAAEKMRQKGLASEADNLEAQARTMKPRGRRPRSRRRPRGSRNSGGRCSGQASSQRKAGFTPRKKSRRW